MKRASRNARLDDDAVGLQNLLIPPIDLEEAAAPGTPAPRRGHADGPMEGAGQEIGQGDAPDPICAQGVGKAGSGRVDSYAQPGGRRERVPLNVVHREAEPAQIIRSPDVPVSLVAAAVDPSEDRFQICSRGHRC